MIIPERTDPYFADPGSRIGRREFLKLGLAFPVFVFLAGLPSGCGEPAIELDGVEIREYQGKRLDSVVSGFRENSIKGPQFIDKGDYRLGIGGLVDRPQSLTYDEVLDRQRYSKVVTLDCVEGWSVTILWEGVLMRDLLAPASVQPEANTVIFRAVDGYSTSFPLTFFHDNDIILASKMNDVTIPRERGFPFMLVAEEKWGYKWIKWVTEIELSDDPSFRGYWEKRGYNHDGAVTGSKFD